MKQKTKKKSNFKDSGKFDSHKDNEYNKSKVNDATWYYKDKNYLDSVATLPFGNRQGLNLKWNGSSTRNVPVVGNYFVNSFGETSGKWSDPLNTAANALYTYMRSKLSGDFPYESADIMLFFIGMSNIYDYFAVLRRAYATLNYYSTTNAAVPKTLFDAMGFDFQDFLNHKNDLWVFLNNIAMKVNSIPVPNTFDYHKKHAWLYSNYFKDSDNDYAAIYVPMPAYLSAMNWDYPDGHAVTLYARFVDSDSKTPLSGANLRTFAIAASELTEMVDRVYNNTDYMHIIGAHIRRVWEPSDMLTLKSVSAIEMVEPVYSTYYLDQLRNATVFDDLDLETGGFTDVVQYGAGSPLTSIHHTSAFSGYTSNGVILKAEGSIPDPEKVIEMTRFISAAKPAAEGALEAGTDLLTSGSEILVGFKPFMISTPDGEPECVDLRITNTVNTSAFAPIGAVRYLSAVCELNGIPEYCIWNQTDNFFTRFAWRDINTVISAETVKKINDAAIIGMFNPASVAKTGK